MDSLIKYFLSFRLLYIIGGGFSFYLMSVLIDPIFIPVLPMPEDFCKKWVETRSGYQRQTECLEFGSKADELKYRHNRKMEHRQANKMIGLFIAASTLTFLLLLLNPSLLFGSEVNIENYTGAVATAVFFGVVIGFVLPTFFQITFPPADDWLPRELLEIRRARVEFILKKIAHLSK
jgi:hypothetical protein